MAKKPLITIPRLQPISKALYKALKSEKSDGETSSVSRLQVTILASLILITLTNLLLVYILVVNQDRALPGQTVLGYAVGFKTQAEIADILRADQGFNLRTYRLSGVDKEYSFTPAEIGIAIDVDKSALHAVSEGKNVPLTEAVKHLIGMAQGKSRAAVFVTSDRAKLDAFLGKVDAETYVEPLSAKITFRNNKPEISNSEAGRKLDKLNTVLAITNAVTAQSSETIEAPFLPLGTTLTEKNKAQWIAKLNRIAEHDFTISYDNRRTVVPRDRVIDMLALETMQPDKLATITLEGKELSLMSSMVAPPAEFRLNAKQIQALVAQLKKEVDQDPVDARFAFDGERVNAFTASSDGKEIDGDKAKEDITRALTAGEATVMLAVKTTQAKVTNESVNNLGIKELIGQGVSNYAGSGEGRAFNLTLGSQKLNGVLVAPGEIFSLYKVLGDVESTTGYKEAYVILNGRTQVGVGGGVCQVSTTLFRAVLNTGLPILERHPHAYRVHYYEEGSSPGMDASVYFPDSDFRFKNDTPGYILIQTNVDPRTNKLTYNIFGTKDNREVTVTTPVISNVRPAPPALYQDDPTLPVGTVKQVDFAAIGAFATFSRTVKKDGVVVAQDRFDSSYQPWQAIYLKGTKTS